MKKLLLITLTSLLIAVLFGCTQPTDMTDATTSDTFSIAETTTRVTETTAFVTTAPSMTQCEKNETYVCFDIEGSLNIDILFANGHALPGDHKKYISVMCEEKDNILTVYYLYTHYGQNVDAPIVAVPIEIYTVEGSFDDFISGKDMKILSTEKYDIGNFKELWNLSQYLNLAENIFIDDYATEGKDVSRHAVHERLKGDRGAGYYIIDDRGEASSADTAYLFGTMDRLLREYAGK